MLSPLATDGLVDLPSLQAELQALGITVVSSRQDTVFAVKIKGLAGQALTRGLQLADHVLHAKILHALQLHTAPATHRFTDPTFGPCRNDCDGIAAMCQANGALKSKGESQHRAKVRGLLERGKLRWERPVYASEHRVESSREEADDERLATASVFASNATLFADGASSGDVIQGNLGDCWFLSALSVVATRFDLLEQLFWRNDHFKTRGVFICRFMKNFVWHYVLIDDRLPVFGFSDHREGKPFFARCRNPNELWVSFVEKAYAKLHGSYEALIGGFIDCALNDLTGLCAEQVILKDGFPGYHDDPFAPVTPLQQDGDSFWLKLLRYKDAGTLMGCSIQPASQDRAVETSAGNGLYFKHAYALVDAAEITTSKGQAVRLVKLRNPWGMGEWTGPWSDASEERTLNEDVIAQYFHLIRRHVGANAEKRIFMTINAFGSVGVETIAQEDVIEINANDGTFFMAFEAWRTSFTHFFAGIDFPDSWQGRRAEGSWNEANCGGNPLQSTWANNPRFELVLEQRARIFVSLSQEDPRGNDSGGKLVPIGFHLCSLVSSAKDASKVELREPPKKQKAYYRRYRPMDGEAYQSGQRFEPLPPAIIPGTVIPGIDDDGVLQPAYTFKQAVSVEATIEPGRYCIVPSMYMQTDKATRRINVGTFWLSVYSDKATFRLEGGERIVEEEEGDDDVPSRGQPFNNGSSSALLSTTKQRTRASSVKKMDAIKTMGPGIPADKRRRVERERDELLRQAKRLGIGVRELRTTFAKASNVSRGECRLRLQKLGLSVGNWDDETLSFLFKGEKSGVVQSESILAFFTSNLYDEQLEEELPDMEEDGDIPDSLHREGMLEIDLHGASGLVIGKKRQEIQRKVQIPTLTYSSSELGLRRKIALEVLERDPSLASQIHPLTTRSTLFKSARSAIARPRMERSLQVQSQTLTPVAAFYELLETEYTARRTSSLTTEDDPEHWVSDTSMPVISKRDTTPKSLSTLPSSDVRGWTEPLPPSNALELHKSNRLRDLEAKRSKRFQSLLQHKQRALGDAVKTASLPRLIGGKKSGSRHVKCIECGARVLVQGRSSPFMADKVEGATGSVCRGSNCVNVFCALCFDRLPRRNQVCEECFQHERPMDEALGEHLRSLLIEKIGTLDPHRAPLEHVFRSFDADGSGTLNPREFDQMLGRLDLQPPLTQAQKAFLTDEFDLNSDGDISLVEFQAWLVRDHRWSEPLSLSSSHKEPAAQVLDTIIAPLCNDIVEVAYHAYAWSSTIPSWSSSSRFTRKESLSALQSNETGMLLFQRLLNLPILATEDANATAKVQERLAKHASEWIDHVEFVNLLSLLGIPLDFNAGILLLNSLGATSSRDGRVIIEKKVCSKYLEQIGLTSSARPIEAQVGHLHTVLLQLDEWASTNQSLRAILQDELHQLHGTMTAKEMVAICHKLNQRAELDLTIEDVQALAFHLTFESTVNAHRRGSWLDNESVNHSLSLNSSGEFLVQRMLCDSSTLMVYVKGFDAAAQCATLLHHLQLQTGTRSTQRIWKRVFQAEPTDGVPFSAFLHHVFETGFRGLADPDMDVAADARDVTALLLALTLDAVRTASPCQPFKACTSPVFVSFNEFRVLMRYQELQDINLYVHHALLNAMLLRKGKQQLLVTIALDGDENLVLRAKDPLWKLAATLQLCPDEFDVATLVRQLGATDVPRRRQATHRESREATFTQAPYGLITSACNPGLDACLLALMDRIRVEHHRQPVTTSQEQRLRLLLVENDAFLSTLRRLLAQVELPFFWSVDQCTLVFTIDSEYLDQQQQSSLPQLVADLLSSKSLPSLRALATFITQTTSSLHVQYRVVGKHATVETTWYDLQTLVSGHHAAYAVLALHPHGAVYTTRVARVSGSGAVQWHFQTQLQLHAPKLCEQRIDRPVVFTDTVKVACVPGSAPSAEDLPFLVGEEDTEVGHYVVVSVRRALPNGPDTPTPRLYCTAYDPLTSCDYAVVGYPANWPLDFFQDAGTPSFDSQWHAMLGMMRLGPTITPTLAIAVFNKQSKTDQLLGECQVALGSAMAQGHHVEQTVVLQSPASTPAGVVAIALCFDVHKTPELMETTGIDVNARRGPIENGAQTLAGGLQIPRTEAVSRTPDDRVKHLQASLASSEASQREAHEQVKQLQAQLHERGNAASRPVDDARGRWKRRLEHARQEQIALNEQHAATVTALQEEVRRLRDGSASKEALHPASNLNDCNLPPHATANEILSAIHDILMKRCPERPYHGLKKALAAEVEVPGKVTFAVLHDVLGDFGFALSLDHQATLTTCLDPEQSHRISIEYFFQALCSESEAYGKPRSLRGQRLSMLEPKSPRVVENEPLESVLFRPNPPSQRPLSPVPSPVRASSGRSHMSWPELKQFLVLHLPDGWETRFTERGRPYFCSHANRSTQWKHPTPEIDAVLTEWVQQNQPAFQRTTVARASRHIY